MLVKKIAFLVNFFEDKNFTGGGEKKIYYLIKELCKRGILVDIYCSRTNVTDNFGFNKLYMIKDEFGYPNLGRLNDKARQILKERGYDRIITENICPPVDVTIIMPHSSLYRQKVVRSFFERFLYRFRESKKNNIKRQLKWAKQGYNRVIASSNVAKYDYSEFLGIDKDKITVIYPSFDIPENIIPSDSPVYIFGLSAPGFDRKGGYIFIKALHLLKRKNNKFKARVIYPQYGKNKWLQFLVKAYGLKNHVEFLDRQNDEGMINFYNSIDCLVVSSREETFGRVAGEAMAHKRLVIIGTRCGASEIIEDGKNGFVFDFSRNISGNLAKKMEYVLSKQDFLDEIANNGHETIKQLTWAKYCDEFLEALKS